MSNRTKDNLIYSIALSLIPKVGPSVYKNIISYSGSAENFFNLPIGKAGKIPKIGPKLLEAIKNKSAYIKQAEKLIEEAVKKDVNILSYQDPNFPIRLKSYEDSPVILFTKGNVDLNPSRSVGIVGTRNATAYGKSITRQIIEDLSPYKPTIISGLAYGIDIEAHRAALHQDLPTVAILGSPVDVIYPAMHKSTSDAMMKAGGVVSEFKLGSEMVPGNFPQRNRVIASLSDALIVVEAAIKGGALITAEIAFSYNKEVFAVPGNLQSPYSEGCNSLIRRMKANIYMGSRDLEEALSWSKEHEKPTPQKLDRRLDEFDENLKPVIKAFIDNQVQQIDDLSWKTQIPISTLASILLQLEFQGIIKSLPGKKYQLIL
ncbi:DNA-processing protein DprA [Anditalea andensis]|uniref:DNA processing protein DprA n=1 Tax=Anditalea andensis TaxID=1048983 RepID=A0A074LFH9_9BACT|nr:DNA-processing protein DprA [Anditalea andensis]KEO72532.1 DNA processing protein DprA [Anditalea andensis]